MLLLRPRRGHRPGRRRLRPRGGVHRPRARTGSSRDFPALKIVLEHITTAEAADFVAAAGANVAATITPQHLIINRNALFAGGLRPHAYCLPVAKREEHRQAIRKAATSGTPNIFLGTDSAPHARDAKEIALRLRRHLQRAFRARKLCRVFEAEGALDKFEAFASEHGARFYGLPLNEGTVTLERAEPSRSGTHRRGIRLSRSTPGETLAGDWSTDQPRRRAAAARCRSQRR